MKSRKPHFNMHRIYTLLILAFAVLFNITACSDSILTDIKPDNGIDKNVNTSILNNKNSIVRLGEVPFENLSVDIPNFAGFHLDRENPSILYALVKGAENLNNASEVKNKIQQYVNNSSFLAIPNINQVILKNAEYNFIQLKNWRDKLFDPLFKHKGVTILDLDEKKNRIFIGVSSESYIEDIITIVTSNGVPVESIIVEEYSGFISLSSKIKLPVKKSSFNLNSLDYNFFTHQTLSDAVRPLTGGLKIYTIGTITDCSMGPIGKWGSTFMFVTAGHCGDTLASENGDLYRQPSAGDEYIGDEIANPEFKFSASHGAKIRYSDAQVVKLNAGVSYNIGTVAATNCRSQFWSDTDPCLKEIRDDLPNITYIGTGIIPVDGAVNKTGYRTGTTIGYVDRLDVDIRSSTSNDILVDQVFASPLFNQRGDSGSPVWSDYVDEGLGAGEAYLIGLLWGRRQNTEEGIYSPMDGIRRDFDDHNFTFFSVQVSISGESSIQSSGTYTYNADITNPVGGVQYQWSIQYEGSTTWTNLGTSSSQDVAVMDTKDFTIRVKVTDDADSDTETLFVLVDYDDEDCTDPTQPCSF